MKKILLVMLLLSLIAHGAYAGIEPICDETSPCGGGDCYYIGEGCQYSASCAAPCNRIVVTRFYCVDEGYMKYVVGPKCCWCV